MTNSPKSLFLIFTIVFSICVSAASAQPSCLKQTFARNQVFSTCNDLPYLNSFLHWTFSEASQTLKIAFRRTGMGPSRYVAWAINPTSTGMVGSQAIVAFQKSDGSMRAYTSSIDAYSTSLQEGDLSFPVSDLSATYANNEITVFATLKLQNLSSTVNQVWQEGPVSNDSPGPHAMSGPNVRSMGTLNLNSGESKDTAGDSGSSKAKKVNTHGFLNAISWGILMPLGAIIARYVKAFPGADPAWFYFHVTCQVSAYVIGVAGFTTGILLGNESVGITYLVHRVVAIVLFALASVQIFSLFIRPAKDHKLRIYWQIVHRVLGYGILVLGIYNVFKGLDMLKPPKEWETAYTIIIVVLGVIAVILEIVTWIVFLRRKRNSANEDSRKENRRNGYSSNGV